MVYFTSFCFPVSAIHHIVMQKYLWSLNLAVWPQTDHKKYAEFKFGMLLRSVYPLSRDPLVHDVWIDLLRFYHCSCGYVGDDMMRWNPSLGNILAINCGPWSEVGDFEHLHVFYCTYPTPCSICYSYTWSYDLPHQNCPQHWWFATNTWGCS